MGKSARYKVNVSPHPVPWIWSVSDDSNCVASGSAATAHIARACADAVVKVLEKPASHMGEGRQMSKSTNYSWSMLEMLHQKYKKDDDIQVVIKKAVTALVAEYHNIGTHAASHIAIAMLLIEGRADRHTRADHVIAALKNFDTECGKATALQIQAACTRDGL